MRGKIDVLSFPRFRRVGKKLFRLQGNSLHVPARRGGSCKSPLSGAGPTPLP